MSMCGKYRCLDETNEELRGIAELLKGKISPSEYGKISLFDVVPSSLSIAVRFNETKGICTYTVMRWGYPGKDRRLVINARSETAFTSWFFRDSLPCVLPASSYYESSRTSGKRYRFETENGTFYLAGLCRMIGGEMHFVIVTEAAGHPQDLIHDRQPVIFDYENAKKWCASKDPSTLLAYSAEKRYATEL